MQDKNDGSNLYVQLNDGILVDEELGAFKVAINWPIIESINITIKSFFVWDLD